VTQRYSPADVAKALGITDAIKILFLAAVMDESFQAGKVEGIEEAQELINRKFAEKRNAHRELEAQIYGPTVETTVPYEAPQEGPYPSCRTPAQCNIQGYCRKDPTCNS
jgi:hypothetical protein